MLTQIFTPLRSVKTSDIDDVQQHRSGALIFERFKYKIKQEIIKGLILQKIKKGENTMKKTSILTAIGIFILLVVAVQPATALKLGGTLNGKYGSDLLNPPLAHLNAAAGRFEGLLNAYAQSIDHDRDNDIANKQVPIDGAGRDLTAALNEFNAALMEVYPTLSEEEQLAIVNYYQSLNVYLENLAVRTNSVFGREVFRIEYGEPLSKTSNSTTQGRFITIIDDLNSDL